jgi:hypothetical protein
VTSFLAITREERFFCTLLVHACLSDETFRGEFVPRLAEVSRTPLDPEDLELYTEVAWVRDYWYDLGDFKKYTAELDELRREQLRSVLAIHLGDAQKAEGVLAAPFIRTVQDRIQSPGRWPLQAIDAFTGGVASGLGQVAASELGKKLRELKWAYNAKPDLLVISDRHPVLIEAKVESGIDYRQASGYNQARISQTIRRLMHVVSSDAVVDTQHDMDFSGITFISKQQQHDPESGAVLLPTILWKEIASWAEASPGLDDFTRKGLLRVARRAQSGDLQTE